MTKPSFVSELCVQAWQQRDQILYPTLFGPPIPGLRVLPAEMFTTVFNQADYEANWTLGGVFEFGPTAQRASWLYATTGLSNAWHATVKADAATPSGLGCEFVLETPFRAPWVINRLHYLMAYHFLVCGGRYPERQPLGVFDRMPLGTSIGAEPSELTWLMLAPPVGFPRVQRTLTGGFEFHQVVGITKGEAATAKTHGGPFLLEGLMVEGAFPVTNPGRKTII